MNMSHKHDARAFYVFLHSAQLSSGLVNFRVFPLTLLYMILCQPSRNGYAQGVFLLCRQNAVKHSLIHPNFHGGCNVRAMLRGWIYTQYDLIRNTLRFWDLLRNERYFSEPFKDTILSIEK